MEEGSKNKRESFKEVLKERLGELEYFELPNVLDMEPIQIENLEKWGKLKWPDLSVLSKKQD